MNIKVMLVEKERALYITGRTEEAQFLAQVLDYVGELEADLSTAQVAQEKAEDALSDLKEELGSKE